MDRVSSLTFLLLSCLVVSALTEDARVWSVVDPTSDEVCVLATFTGHLTVLYPTVGTELAKANVAIPLEKTSVVEARSFCTAGTTAPAQRVVVSWPAATIGTAPFNLSLSFDQTNFSAVQFEYDLGDLLTFPNATANAGLQTVAQNQTTLGPVTKEKYYQCRTGATETLTNKESFTTTLVVADVKLAAFRTDKTKTFDGTPTVCSADDTSSSVSPPTDEPSTVTTEKSTEKTEASSTTEKPTEAPSTTEKPTEAPSTTEKPTEAPSTTEKPTEPPVTVPTTESTTAGPTDQVYYVKDDSAVCLIAIFEATFHVQYNATDAENKTSLQTATVTVPKDAMVNTKTSFCTAGTVKSTQRLALTWSVNSVADAKPSHVYNLSLTFTQQADGKDYVVSQVQLQYDLTDAITFVNASSGFADLQTATSPVGVDVATIAEDKYLRCYSGVPVELVTLDPMQNFTSHGVFTNAKLQAFRQSNTTTFDSGVQVCAGDPTVGNYTVWTKPNHQGSICLMALFDLSFAVEYKQVNKSETAKAQFPLNGTVNEKLSHCGEASSLLVIDEFIPDWQLSLNFTQNAGKYSLVNVQLDFSLKDSTVFSDSTNDSSQVSMTDLNKWGATVNHSYKCLGEDTWALSLAGTGGLTSLLIMVAKVQVQAFVAPDTMHWSFGDAETCPVPTSDVVPIAVGCALAALVVIVLIAYVIGRRRNRARGYESM